MKDQLKILTCGSVDDGKSTLIGHMLYSSKKLYTDQIKALELDSKIKQNGEIDYSLLLDGLDEEREQGITIDVAYRYFNTEKRNFIILDAPGHEEYTRNMAVGASQADVAILLVDATKGMLLQTKRHFKICIMMGIKDYIVAINKMDLVNYNKEIFDNISADLLNLIKPYSVNSIQIIPVSATEGDNVASHSKKMTWYAGYNLLRYLESIKLIQNKTEGFILPIQRVCRQNLNFRGFQGNVVAGTVKKGDEIFCLPSNEKAKIKNLYNTNKERNFIKYGEAVTLTLDKEIDISRGCILTNDTKISIADKLNVTMLWMEEEKLKLNVAYYINIGTKSTLCYIRKINYKTDINTDQKIQDEEITKNEIINCDIEILENIPVTTFNYNKTLGSMILINRINNFTSACAVVEKIYSDNKNIFEFSTSISKEDRSNALNQNPLTIWFTGLSCSGKSTIANELDKILNYHGFHTVVLDGDNIRSGLNKDLSFTEKDRIENIRRIAEVAKITNDAGLICLTAFISPLEVNRIMAKSIIGSNFFLVYVNTPIEECEKRDKKGLYKKARTGIINNFTGIDSPFEEPKEANVVLNNIDFRECAEEIYNSIKDRI